MKHFIMLLFSLLLAVACREQVVLAPIVEFEEVDNADNLTQQIESIQLVPLENDGHYFGWSADLLLLDNGFLVVDKENCQIIRYDSKGRFLNRIGEQGNGPGEYPDVFNVQLSADKIVVFSSPGVTRHLFDYAGNYLGKEYVESGGQQFAVVPEGVLCFNGYGMPEKCKASLLKRNGETTSFYPYNSEIVAFGDINNVFSFDRNRVFVRDQLEPVVYIYQAGNMQPCVRFNFGKFAFEDNFYSMDYMASATYLMQKDLCLVSRYMESGDVRLVEVTRPLERRSYYGLSVSGKWEWSYMGIEEQDAYASSIKVLDGHSLYALVSPGLVKKIPSDWLNALADSGILDGITEDSNDVVVRIVLKK